jgi:TolA-binding protein
LRAFAPEACAALLVAGCAGAGAARPEVDALRVELRELRAQNEALSSRVDALSSKVDLLTMSASRPVASPPAQAARAAELSPPGQAAPGEVARAGTAVVVPDLAVVKVVPAEEPRAAGRAGAPRAAERPAQARAAPPIPTAVPIQDPDPARLDALGSPGRRPLSAQAEAELRAARAQAGLARAHALEDFAAHYPQHPSADNALSEAAAAYLSAGRDDAGCSLSRRVVDEYPAGDAVPDALLQAAGCEHRRGDPEAAQRLLARLRADFPGTSAAQRAEAQLSQISGRRGGSPPDVSARSGP